MPEQVQKIANQILEWWKKFNTKQKALLISIVATIILALVILAVLVSKPTMVVLHQCTTTSEAGEVKDLLDKEGVSYQLSDDGLTFYVDQKDNANASILLGQMVFQVQDLVLMMYSVAVSVQQSQIRTKDINFICRTVLKNS